MLSGADINLVKILLCSPEMKGSRVLESEDVSLVFKDSDPRLTKVLNFTEFVTAFSVYRDVICEVQPARLAEFNSYLCLIADIHTRYGGSVFYDYHKAFSARAALQVIKFNRRIDWSVMDIQVYTTYCSGRQALSCNGCGSFGHLVGLCPKLVSRSAGPSAKPAALGQGRGRFFWRKESELKGAGATGASAQAQGHVGVCFNFNEGVCSYPMCRFLHACSFCGEAHPQHSCPRKSRMGRGRK